MLEESVIKRLARVDCIVLDLDGVLLEGTNEGYFDCHRHALECVCVTVPEQQLRRRLLQYWSYPHEFQLSLFIDDEATLAAACKAYEALLFSDEFSNRISQIPGATQTITQLSTMGYRLAVASGMHHKQIPTSLSKIGIDPALFSVCLSAFQLPDNTLQKPHPYMLERILAELNTLPERALCVGDSVDDIRMSRAANVLAVAVLTGNMSRAEAEQEGSDIVLKSIHELIPAICGHGDAT
jgi:phosphoglycolate phosphatase-like HAD superfamily hydrolase